MAFSWDPDTYARFEDERTRPARDLIAGIPRMEPRSVIDLGCGPGNSTEALCRAFPGAEVLGVDSSPEMVSRARERLPDVEFRVMDVRDVPAGWDLMFSNACLHWLPDHTTLFPELMSKLNPGGVLAVQMPVNDDEPISVISEEVAAEEHWEYSGPMPVRRRLPSPREYYDILCGCSEKVDVWTTAYHHVMPSHEALVEWVKGSRLRPYLGILSREQAAEMEAEVLRKAKDAYGLTADGNVLLRYDRLFLVAKR